MNLRRPPASLRERALAWLARREHSRSELHAKLSRWAATSEHSVEPSQIDELLDSLQAAGHLSDERFLHSLLHRREARSGTLLIQHRLRQHGLALDDATQARLRAGELERARKVWQARFGGRDESGPRGHRGDRAERARQARFLASRGFSPDTIRRVLDRDPDPDPGRGPDRDPDRDLDRDTEHDDPTGD